MQPTAWEPEGVEALLDSKGTLADPAAVSGFDLRAYYKKLVAARVLDVLSAGQGDALQAITDDDTAGQFRCDSYTVGNTALICLGGKVAGGSLEQMGFGECLAQDKTAVFDRMMIINVKVPLAT